MSKSEQYINNCKSYGTSMLLAESCRPAVCPRCGKPFSGSTGGWVCGSCSEEQKDLWKDFRSPFDEPTGWRCPSCGRVYAPGVEECGVCNDNA